MAIRATSGTVQFTRQQGIPTSVASFNALSFGVWVKFTALPLVSQDIIVYGFSASDDRVAITMNSTGQFHLRLDNAPAGTGATTIVLNRWYYIVYTKTGGDTHKLKLCWVDPTTNLATTPITDLTVVQVVDITMIPTFFVLTTTNTMYVTMVRFYQGSTGENAIAGLRSAWTNGGYWSANLRHPLDLYDHRIVSGATTFAALHAWDDISGSGVTRVADPANLVNKTCTTFYYELLTGAQIGHADLPPGSSRVSTPAFLNWILDDDGRIPTDATSINITLGGTKSNGSGFFTGLGEGWAIPSPYDDAYSMGDSDDSLVYFKASRWGTIRYDTGSGWAGGYHPETGELLTRADIFDLKYEIIVSWGPNSSTTLTHSCKNYNIADVCVAITFNGDYDGGTPPPGPEDPYDPNTSPCRDDNQAWWFDDFDNLSSLSPTYNADGSITLTPNGGVDGSPAVTGDGGLTRPISPDQRSFSISFRHKF